MTRFGIAVILLVLNIRVVAILITTIGILGSLADTGTPLPESEGDQAAQQT